MKEFAAIDSNSIVTRIVVAGDSDTVPAIPLKEGETSWIQFSNDAPFLDKANPAQVGCEYKSTEGVFCGLQLYPSWTLNTTTWRYEAPVREPGADEIFLTEGDESPNSKFSPVEWDEENQLWWGYVLSAQEGAGETDRDKYIWNPDDSSWTYDSTVNIEAP